MLVIRRRAGESLLIGDNIEVEILDLGPTQVKLGIRAPREVTVMRNEVRLTRDENRTACGVSEQVLASLVGALSHLPAAKNTTS